jgi:micrococcal nuclease
MKISGMKYFVILLSLLVFSCNSNNEKEGSDGYMLIKKFVDGDTFWVDDGSEKGLKIRLIGVNTPETVHPQKPVEFYGIEAANYIKEILDGKKVRLEFDVAEKDKYGRTLAYVFLKDGTFINAELLKNGYGSVMTIPPNVKYAEYFVELEREARENNRGLWDENY